MKITITTTFDISEENKPLIPVVTEDLKYQEWVENTKNEALRIARDEVVKNNPEIDILTITLDDIFVDVSQETFIKQFLSNDYTMRLKNIVSPSINKFFGLVMQNRAVIAKSQLDTAINTEVTITE